MSKAYINSYILKFSIYLNYPASISAFYLRGQLRRLGSTEWKTTDEQINLNDVEGSGHGLFQGTIRELAWKD